MFNDHTGRGWHRQARARRPRRSDLCTPMCRGSPPLDVEGSRAVMRRMISRRQALRSGLRVLAGVGSLVLLGSACAQQPAAPAKPAEGAAPTQQAPAQAKPTDAPKPAAAPPTTA